METISVNKQLLQEDSRGTEKSDTDLARRQESHWLSSEARTVRNIYVQLNSIHFGACVICLRHPQCHTSDFGQQKQHFFPFSTVPFPDSQILCLGSVPFLPPSKSFFLSLSLWQVSHSIARKEADVPNLRYTPDPSAFYLTGIRRFQNRHFLMEQILSNTYLKKKTNKKH